MITMIEKNPIFRYFIVWFISGVISLTLLSVLLLILYMVS